MRRTEQERDRSNTLAAAWRWSSAACFLGLAGCNPTTFENPPLTEAPCDPQLVGEWKSIAEPEKHLAAGEMSLQIDKRCSLSMSGPASDREKQPGPMSLHLGVDGTTRYAWIGDSDRARTDDPSKPNGSAPGEKSRPDPKAGFVVIRYEVASNELRVYNVDGIATAHHVLDGLLTGTIEKRCMAKDVCILSVSTRIDGQVTPEQFRSDIVFESKPSWRFAKPLETTEKHP